jgi:hypothetical protein
MKILLTFFSFLIFCNNNSPEKNQIIIKPNKENFASSWKIFVNIVSKEKINTQAFATVSSNMLDCNDEKVKLSVFVKTYLSKVFDEKIKSRIANDSNFSFYESEIEPSYFKQFDIKYLDSYTIKKVSILKNNNNKTATREILELCFIQTKNGFKFFGYKTY